MESPERAVREEVAATIERAGLEALDPDEIRVEVTPSLRRRLGDCRPITDSHTGGNGTPRYKIRIAARLFIDHDDAHWRDTVRHEVAHAAVFERHGVGIGHGPAWKDAARRAGANPQAACEIEEGFEDVSYVLACPNGCSAKGYLKRSKRIKQPWQYACKECESALISYDVEDPPSDPDPGRCYVSSIPWTAAPEGIEEPTARYVLACPAGCRSRPYQQRSKRIKQPWRYGCPECGASMISYDAGNEPADPTPGTCYVSTIGWDGPRYTLACPSGCFENHYLQEPPEVRIPSNYRCPECGTHPIAYPVDEPPENPSPGTRYDEEGRAADVGEAGDRSGRQADRTREQSTEGSLRPIDGLPARPLALTEVLELARGDQFEFAIPATDESIEETGPDTAVVHDVILFRESSVSVVAYHEQRVGWFLVAREDNAGDGSAFGAVGRAIVDHRGYRTDPADVVDATVTAYAEGLGIDIETIEAILERGRP